MIGIFLPRARVAPCLAFCLSTTTNRRVRRRLRRVQGTREPASPPSDPSVVPLRRTRDLCAVDAETEEEALGLLPRYVAERTTASRVSEVEIP